MARKPSASSLFEHVAFESPVPVSGDGGGGVLNGFTRQFYERAEFIHIRGSESVLANRLEGRHVQVIRVRSSQASRAATTDWRIVNTRTSEVFNIRDITPTVDRGFLDCLAERGVAS